MSFCTSCGSKIPEEGAFCAKCGAHVNSSPIPEALASSAQSPQTRSNAGAVGLTLFALVLLLIVGGYFAYHLSENERKGSASEAGHQQTKANPSGRDMAGHADATQGAVPVTQEQRLCIAARASNNDEAWRAYFQAYPEGACAEEALTAVPALKEESDRLGCAAAKKADSIEAWIQYQEDHPQGECTAQAEAALRKNLWLTQPFPCKAVSTAAIRQCRLERTEDNKLSLRFKYARCTDVLFGEDGNPSELRGCSSSGLRIPSTTKLRVAGDPPTWSGSHGGWRWADGDTYCCPGMWLMEPTESSGSASGPE